MKNRARPQPRRPLAATQRLPVNLLPHQLSVIGRITEPELRGTRSQGGVHRVSFLSAFASRRLLPIRLTE